MQDSKTENLIYASVFCTGMAIGLLIAALIFEVMG